MIARDGDAQACGKSLFEVPKFAVNRDLTLTFVAARPRPGGRAIYISQRKSSEGESPIRRPAESKSPHRETETQKRCSKKREEEEEEEEANGE